MGAEEVGRELDRAVQTWLSDKTRQNAAEVVRLCRRYIDVQEEEAALAFVQRITANGK